MGSQAFNDCNNIQSVSVFVPNPKDPNIQQNSFSAKTYTNATLYIPSISYDKYYWDTKWSQFANLGKTTWTYDRYPSSDDTEISENTGSLPDGSSIDVGIKGGVFVELPQNLVEITVERNKNFGGSIINNGGNRDEGWQQDGQPARWCLCTEVCQQEHEGLPEVMPFCL